jgi:HK97 family phage major capsid protein
MEDITKALAQVQDDAFFNGLSGNNQPVGLLNTTGVNEVTLPATPTLSTALEFEKKIRESNDYSGELKWVFGTDAYYKWASTPYSATEQNKMLLDDETRKCIGYDAFIDHNIPASTVILGNFSEALEADFDGIAIRVITEDLDLATSNAVAIIAYAANDYVFRRPKSFTKGV